MMKEPVIVLTDQVTGPQTGSLVSKLPPSGYQPGHLLRDTLKNDVLHTPPYMAIGYYAHHKYLSSPIDLQRRVSSNLEQIVQPLDVWLAWLKTVEIDFICIGESHQENYRHFLAQHFFPHYPLDALYIEARELPAKIMNLRADIGEDHIDLLNADIASIIRVARSVNPNIVIIGIEESGGQRKNRRESLSGSRDQSIYENIIEHYVPGQRAAALLGALHCNHRWNWLYTKLDQPDSPLATSKLLNMRLLSERKDLLSREWNRFMELMGYSNDNYVLMDTRSLDPLLHEWFLDLTDSLVNYQSVVLFRSEYL